MRKRNIHPKTKSVATTKQMRKQTNKQTKKSCLTHREKVKVTTRTTTQTERDRLCELAVRDQKKVMKIHLDFGEIQLHKNYKSHCKLFAFQSFETVFRIWKIPNYWYFVSPRIHCSKFSIRSLSLSLSLTHLHILVLSWILFDC